MSASDRLWVILGSVGAILGSVLLAWALWWDRSRGRRRCPRCWYDMGGVSGLLCPECGKDALSELRLGRTRRRWGWALAGTAGVLMGVVTVRYPAISAHGWTRAVPAVIWRTVLPFVDPPPAEPTVAWIEERINTPPFLSTRWSRLLVAHRCLVVLRHMEKSSERDRSRSYVLSMLGRAGRDGALAAPAVRRLLESSAMTPDERLFGLQTLPSLDPSRATLECLSAAAAGEPDAKARTTAIRMIGYRYRNDPGVVDQLYHFAAQSKGDEAFTVGPEAIAMLGHVAKHGGEAQRWRAMRRLEELASGHSDAWLRGAAAWQLDALQATAR